MFGDIIENLKVADLRSGIGTPEFSKDLKSNHPILAAPRATNQQIIDATQKFYGQHQVLVDTSTTDVSNASKNGSFVKQLNSNDWKSQQLTQGMQTDTSKAIFNDSNGGDGSLIGHAAEEQCDPADSKCKGLFGQTLCQTKASDLFTTISVGVNAEAIFFVGGMGGIGCAFDIAKREQPRGYGFATAELGVKIALDFNVQVGIFNVLPSQLNMDIFGLSVGAYVGGGASFYMFYDASDWKNLKVLGYSVGVGVGMGAGAAVFGGHIWNFS